MSATDTETLADLDICEQARKIWRDAITREADLRKEWTRRLRYRAGDQWFEVDTAARGKDRPQIVVNLLEQPVQQVINQNLLNRPGGNVSPADGDADSTVAEYLEGRIRHIEYASDCQVAYATAIGYVAAGGYALIGLTVDYVSPESLEQEVRIRAIEDPANWAVDRSADDRRWAIGRQQLSVEEFRQRWPDAVVVDAAFERLDHTYSDWGNSTHVWIAEYWRLDYYERTLQRYSDGSQGFLDDQEFQDRLKPGVRPVAGKANQRKVDYPKVMQYFISGAEVLETTEWEGTRIPIYEVVATEFWADGKRVVKSLISDALPSQQTYNCSESLKLEAVVLAPKPKWLMSSEQLAGHEDRWQLANTSNDAVLFYNGAQDSRGNPIPPPDWKVFVPPVQEFTLVSNQAKEDVKATTGFFDPSLGAFDAQRQSAKAILALQQQTGQGTAHFSENLARALKQLYQDLIELDLKLNRNSGPVKRRVTLPNGQHQLVTINDPGQAKKILLEKGRYEVIVSVGPSWRNQREATATFLQSTAANDPQGWALIRDLGARLMEPQLGHYADEIATRWQAALPPGVAQQDPNQPPLPPQVQQQLAFGQQLLAENQQMKQVIQQKQVEEQGRYQRDMAVEQQKFATEELKAATQIRVAELNARNDQLLTMMDARVRQLEAQADRVGEMLKLGHSQAHEAGLQAMKHAHAMHQAQAQYENEIQPAETEPPPNGSENGAGAAIETQPGA